MTADNESALCVKKLRLHSRAVILLAVMLFAWAGVAAAQTVVLKPEKTRLEVAMAGTGSTSLPLLVTLEGGYFSKRGLTVNLNRVSASVSVQGVISGTIDIYQGGAAAIAGNLAGADIIYVAAAVDKSSLNLFGQKGVTTFEALRGKAISTTSPGAFGENRRPWHGAPNGFGNGQGYQAALPSHASGSALDFCPRQRRRAGEHAATD